MTRLTLAKFCIYLAELPHIMDLVNKIPGETFELLS